MERRQERDGDKGAGRLQQEKQKSDSQFVYVMLLLWNLIPKVFIHPPPYSSPPRL